VNFDVGDTIAYRKICTGENVEDGGLTSPREPDDSQTHGAK
jgi:hypothetical protein